MGEEFKPYGVPADWVFYVDSIWINMKVPSTGEQGGAPPLRGGPNSGPKRSPELIENSFSDKSAMAKRLELVLGPGDFEKHGFQAILGAQKRPKKNHTF